MIRDYFKWFLDLNIMEDEDMANPKHVLYTIDKFFKPKDGQVDYSNNIPCLVLNQDVPIIEAKSYGSKYGGNKLPRFILLVDVNYGPFGNDSRTVYYRDPEMNFQVRNVYLHKDFQLGELTHKMKDTLIARHTKYQEEHLASSLSHSFAMGSDPEVFVVDKDNVVIPAFDFLKDKKTNPHYYWDGFQAEFTTNAGSCLDGQTHDIFAGLAAIRQVAVAFNKDAKLSLTSTMIIPEETMKKASDEHIALACNPSRNVYGTKGLEVPDARLLNIRSAGGHIHFGIGPMDQASIDRGVKALDAVLGVACVSLFAKYDTPLRRQYYGQAGEYRLPKHGLEYRTLSNAWLCHPLIFNVVMDISRKVLMLGLNNLGHLWDATEKEVVECINTCDVDSARRILKRNKDVFLKICSAAYRHRTTKELEIVYDMFMNGMESVVSNPEDLFKNWGMDSGSYGGRNFYGSLPKLKKGEKVAA